MPDRMTNNHSNPDGSASNQPDVGIPDLPTTTINAVYGTPPYRPVSFMLLNSTRISCGTFGVVFKAVLSLMGPNPTTTVVAVKKVFQDPRYKNRELQIIRKISHPNVTTLHYFFHLEEPTGNYLCLVMDYIPCNLFDFYRKMMKNSQKFPVDLLRIISYQIGQAIGYIHSLGICHRDIKPTNLLFHPTMRWLKLCDFGSAKELVAGEQNVSYICSRHYRAPELILGQSDYSFSIDVWAVGCVLAELIMGRPTFPGKTNSNQLVWIMKVLGHPTEKDLRAMVPELTDRSFLATKIKSLGLNAIMPGIEYSVAIDLIGQMLTYDPSKRIEGGSIIKHSFFEPIRTNAGNKYRDLFVKPPNFSEAITSTRNGSTNPDSGARPF